MILLISLLLTFVFNETAAAQNPQQKKVRAQVEDSAGSLFEAGQNAHQQGDLDKAIELYGEALKRDPSMWPAELQLSIAYLSLNHLAEARASLDHVLAQLAEFGDSPELRGMMARAQVVRGEIALAEGDRDEAEVAFRRALELNPQVGRAHAGLAEILLVRDKIAEAEAEAKAAIKASDNRPSTWALLGIAQLRARQYDEALISLNEAIKRDSRQLAALRSRAEVFIARGKLPEAIADLRSASQFDTSSQVKLRLAEVFSQAKQHSEAIELFQQILKAEPDNAEARTGLAAVMIESGRADEAISELEALIEKQPNRADLRAQLGELYLAKQPDRAFEHYSAAAKLEPHDVRYQIGIGTSLVRLRRFQDAVPVLRGALAQNPPDEIAYFAHTNLATALFELDDFASAGNEYIWILKRQQALGDRRRIVVTLYFLGICLDKLGDYEQALKAYEQFLELASSENQLEIDKVKLRLPSLQRQIQKGQSSRKRG